MIPVSRDLLFTLAVVVACAATLSCADSSSTGNPPSNPPTHRVASPRSDFDAFLAAADAAEARFPADKLNRCLAYPDPPLSHWSHPVVAAYCQYLFQPAIAVSDVRELIDHGHAKELDQRLADALQAQLSQHSARGLLDRIFAQDFDEAPDDLRPVLDKWKSQSPNSAFALAASGDAYVAAADRARGGDYIENTPQHKIDAMDQLMTLAKADLEKAVAIEPRLTPVYTSMIDAGGHVLGRQYAQDAAARGLHVDPSNFDIYAKLLWLAQPKWGGSEAEIIAITNQAQEHASDNPLLMLLKVEPQAATLGLDDCGCRADSAPDYYELFDQAAVGGLLESAGLTSAAAHKNGPAAIYLSEAFRFGWGVPENISAKINALVELHKPESALGLANRHLALKPDDEERLELRAMVYSQMKDSADAEKDMLKILSITKDDLWVLNNLAHTYVENTHEWDKAWAITDRLIKEYPGKSDGWLLRGMIQANQPRPGLKDTVDYYQAHFGDDPDEQTNLNALKYWLAHSAAK